MPAFSVLLSVYQKEKPAYLEQAIESLLRQTLPADEIVIVKDGLLTKELEQVIEKSLQKHKGLFTVVSLGENRGLGPALREGISVCRYDYIARMDTDDIARPDRFARQMAYMQAHPDIALLGTWIKEFSKSATKPDTATELPCSHEEILAFAKSRNPFRHMTVVFNKQAVLNSGNYRDFLWFEDYDLWVRMLQKGYRAANLPEFLVDVRADSAMFARRGGRKYLEQEVKFQKFLWKSGFITALQFVRNVAVRSVVRLLPEAVRARVYKGFLRRQNK